jgi:hypothetical protein
LEDSLAPRSSVPSAGATSTSGKSPGINQRSQQSRLSGVIGLSNSTGIAGVSLRATKALAITRGPDGKMDFLFATMGHSWLRASNGAVGGRDFQEGVVRSHANGSISHVIMFKSRHLIHPLPKVYSKRSSPSQLRENMV